jgi:plasmid stabilization system protein ParE
MEQRDIQVVWDKRAVNSLKKLHQYIAKRNPENATRFINRMKEYGNRLGDYPEKYPHNRFEKYTKFGYHTAVFESNYIFFYKVRGKKLHICSIFKTSRLK